MPYPHNAPLNREVTHMVQNILETDFFNSNISVPSLFWNIACDADKNQIFQVESLLCFYI